jgi:hypothetical protein
MEAKTTLEASLPARAAAREAPGQWREFTRANGERVAVLTAPKPNHKHPGIMDGIYIEITQPPGVRPLVWACTTRPDQHRHQLTHAQRYENWDAAHEAAEAYLEAARRFLHDPAPTWTETARTWKKEA